jgi:hypothetical protein
MPVDRVHSSNSRIYVNETLLTGISNYDLSYNLKNESLKSLNHYETTDKILLSKQSPEINLSWTLGEQSSDPFFDFQSSGIISVESFNIKLRDTVGERIVSGCSLTDYSLKAGVGELISAAAKFEGNSLYFSTGNALSINDQTSDYYQSYIPQKILLSSSFANGNIINLPVQSFNIQIPISRQSQSKLGNFNTEYKIPVLPIEASVSFSAIKNILSGIDLSDIILEKGSFNFTLQTCSESNNKNYSIGDCSLVSISESLDLEGNALVNFSYTSSITNSNFSLNGSQLLDSLGVALYSSDSLGLSYST